jgi:hypothetical protein
MKNEKVLIFSEVSPQWKDVIIITENEAREYMALEAAQNGAPASYTLSLFFAMPNNRLVIYNESDTIKTIREDCEERLKEITKLTDKICDLEDEIEKLQKKRWWKL